MLPIEPSAVVFFLLKKHAGLGTDKIHPDSRLFHDLGIDGDDADELFIELADHCGVDISGVDFTHYFRGEPTSATIFNRDPVKGKRPLTVQDLIDAVASGKLVLNPVPPPSCPSS